MKPKMQMAQQIRQQDATIRQTNSAFAVSQETARQAARRIARLELEAFEKDAIIADYEATSATLTDERDAARRMWCEYDNSVNTKEWFAAQQGWEYLYAIPEP